MATRTCIRFEIGNYDIYHTCVTTAICNAYMCTPQMPSLDKTANQLQLSHVIVTGVNRTIHLFSPKQFLHESSKPTFEKHKSNIKTNEHDLIKWSNNVRLSTQAFTTQQVDPPQQQPTST